jgi:flavin-dependent dehydrogenase
MAAGFRRALCKESFWAIDHTGTARDGFAPIRQMRSVLILGAGPAGSAAAIAALAESVPVSILEKSLHRRHKVCGEFISPEACGILAELGVWEQFLRLEPTRIRDCVLHFGRLTKKWTMPEYGYGLSRYELDGLLLQRAAALGATVSNQVVPNGSFGDHSWADAPEAAGKLGIVLATGRRAAAAPGKRLFGFKAHFEGPADDAVELFFFSGGYVGVSCVEHGITNVCGIAPESALHACGFRLDEFVLRSEALAERLRPLSRKFKWLTVGPLVYSSNLRSWVDPITYPAGDALGFVDPFTGSGILNALLTGWLSGSAAAQGLSSQGYVARCGALLAKPYRTSALFRGLLDAGCAQHLAALIPGSWLFRLTRVGRLATYRLCA